MPETAFTKTAYPNGGNLKGDVYALSSPDGTGVIFKVKLSGLPSEGGPFSKSLVPSRLSIPTNK